MLKKTIKYFDFDGNEREEDFYFNLTRAEAIELELGIEGGVEQYIKKITGDKDNRSIVDFFKDIILRSYGEKSADGKRFMKSAEISNGFASTEAYSELFIELTSSTEAATAFFNGIVPNVDKIAGTTVTAVE